MNKTTGLVNPAYLAIDPSRQYLYCVNEGKNADNQGDTISAFSIQPKTGMLTFLNRQPAEGEAPCHISDGPNREWRDETNDAADAHEGREDDGDSTRIVGEQLHGNGDKCGQIEPARESQCHHDCIDRH